MGTTILLGIISIGILIFVHEFGHFLAARASGIRVEVFSIGWGRGLVSFNWKGTKIQLGWIPFGGYCKMAGDSPRDDLTGSPDEYYSSPPLKRILVALAGPFFNYAFAAILFIAIIAVGYQINTFSNRILLSRGDTLIPGDVTPAEKAGLKDGDRIIAINGKETDNWDDITEQIVRNGDKPITITVRRGSETLTLNTVPFLDEDTGRGVIGIYPLVEPIVGSVASGEPASRAGFREGDRIISVDGEPIRHHIDFYNAIEGKSGEALHVIVERDGARLPLTLVPEEVDGYASPGLVFKQITVQSPSYPLYIAAGKGLIKSAEAVRDTVRGIALVVSGKIRARSAVAGPAKLIYLSGLIAREGFTYFLRVMSYISIAFFIMNLIPFPALDGSHIVISLYEVVARRKPNIEVIYKIQTFGFIVLIIALIFVTMNDISSLWRG
jgi:regulator of sigma E protease